jgi:hypothetical protein
MKKAWVTREDTLDLYALSFESEGIQEHERLAVKELIFPRIEPKRHTICLTYLTEDDLYNLYEAIGRELYK